MRLVVDANVIISALMANSTSRELLVFLDHEYLTPEFIHQEITKYNDRIVEKSDLSEERVERFLSILFADYITTIPGERIADHLDEAEDALGDIDKDDVLYLATALAEDAGIWSDDGDFQHQELVPVFTTAEMVDQFDPE